MAGSVKCGPLNPPSGICLVPERTCGPLGLMDQADPNVTSLLGDTPGPLGVNDCSSAELMDASANLKFSPQVHCRTSDGTPLALGSALSEATAVADEGTKITLALLIAADSTNSEDYYNSILASMNDYASVYAINTPLRVAHFLSQIAHESHFKIVEEGGNYNAKRMRQVFGCKGGQKKYNAAADECTAGRLRSKLWDEESKYAHNAKNLLSYVYASRLGNGDEASGEGYKYRGRGMMQLTGKNNYSAFTEAHNKMNPNDQRDFVSSPELLINETKYGIESAFFFWDHRGLNDVADTDDVNKVTETVNGGLNGLEDRKTRLNKLKQVLGI
ncbi:MAG: glycoside hydrolase family 19 protein [Gammaproteobacteria bacterium]